jgi:predicted RecB family nuclease
MRLEIRASDIKNWFQYRCDRQLIYAALPRDQRDAIPVVDEGLDDQVRIQEGNEFEQEVLRTLVRREGAGAVLRPAANARALSPELTQAFLQGLRPERFAYQPLLQETAALRADLKLPENVSIREGLPDLLEWVEEEGERRIRVIDIKHTRRPTQYHQAQAAFYALMLRGHFASFRSAKAPIHTTATIWHIAELGGKVWEDQEGQFTLRGMEEMIRDFFRRQIDQISRTVIVPGRDESFFHLYFKCEQCKWMKHCGRTIANERSPESWDISAIPGMSHQTKRVLHDMGLRTLRSLADAPGLGQETWALRSRGPLLRSRAQALLTERWSRLPGHHTWLMPPRVDVPIFIVVDRDPVAGHLATVGCRFGGVRVREPVIEVISRRDQELPALKRVLGALLDVLSELDRHNASVSEEEGLRAHIFVYESSEAVDLRSSLANYLDDSEIRTGLLNIVRLFPPEEVRAPEPEYRGAHHLPASALRSVMEQIYVLPAKVSYDLARVSGALASTSPPMDDPYMPKPPFARPFSARLSIEVSRRLNLRPDLVAQTREDVDSRLRAMEGLCHWILDDNAMSGDNFLRLRKPPFRFQEQFHPLEAVDLDVLLAHELLQSRAERLARLIELARPANERRERLRCFAEMTLSNVHPHQGGAILEFKVPTESRQSELVPGTLGLILTNDDPDLRLDPTFWAHCAVELLHQSNPHPEFIRVQARKRVWTSPTMRRLMQSTPENAWFLDQSHVDVTTDRMGRFLRFLSDGST